MLGTAKKRALTTAGAVLGVVIVSGATASASIPSSSGTIYGCYAKTNGATRIIDPARQKCSGMENPISWNQRGPRGPQGPQGPQGDTGSPGVAGVSGYEVLTESHDHQSLPRDDGYELACPSGKHVLGGGAIIQLYDDSGFEGLGTPEYSIPQTDGSEWLTWMNEAGVGTNPYAVVTLTITCAVTGP